MKVTYRDVNALDFEMDNKILTSGRAVTFEIFFDDECPMCGYGIDMKRSVDSKSHDIKEKNQAECRVACVHYCPHCHKLFMTEHMMCLQSNDYYREKSHAVYPYSSPDIDIPEEISKVSAEFGHLYKQAYMAKNCGMQDLFGMALRKAFEYLIKDYALFLNPDKEDEIAKKLLVNCINDYVENDKIKSLCTSCRLIGNNETHWRNENSAEDVEFMEKVLLAVIRFIDQEMVVIEAQNYNKTHRK